MTYIRLHWLHDRPDEPIWLFSELDDLRREVRKVESSLMEGRGLPVVSKLLARRNSVMHPFRCYWRLPLTHSSSPKRSRKASSRMFGLGGVVLNP